MTSITLELGWQSVNNYWTGLTHAAVWAAGVSYMTQAIPEENKPTAQMILQSLHLAVGRGCGTVIGGIFISSYGQQFMSSSDFCPASA